jgi:hypothetical protein
MAVGRHAPCRDQRETGSGAKRPATAGSSRSYVRHGPQDPEHARRVPDDDDTHNRHQRARILLDSGGPLGALRARRQTVLDILAMVCKKVFDCCQDHDHLLRPDDRPGTSAPEGSRTWTDLDGLPMTTDPAAARLADLVQRQFSRPAPDRLWAADFTCVPTWSGMVMQSDNPESDCTSATPVWTRSAADDH